MSKHYLDYRGNKRLVVMNEEDQVVYLIKQFETYLYADYITFDLFAVAFRERQSEDWRMVVRSDDDDYPYPDDALLNLYLLEESLFDALEAENYTILKEIPDDLNQIINEYLGY